MEYKFLNIFLDKKDLNSQPTEADRLLIESNQPAIEKIYDFLGGKSDILCINGFLGTGKSQIANYALSFLSTEALVLNYECFESTILDDILLAFYAEFKKLSAQKIISEPKIKTENFAQKINSYFKEIEKPFLILINSFEGVLEENRREIMDFIFHLSNLPKVKVILISKTFDSKLFPDGLRLERLTLMGLEKNQFEKFLKKAKLKYNSMLLDEFYKKTRGYYFFTVLMVKILANKGKSLSDLLEDSSKSYLSFDNYLKKLMLDEIPATYRNLFWFLSLFRHGVSEELLRGLNLYEEEKIEFFRQNFFINSDKSGIYVKDYFAQDATEGLAPNISQKLHRYIIELYQSQLPLRPLERNILISRQTMRKEIEYHMLFLPKRPKAIDSQDMDANYLAYATSRELELSQKNQNQDDLRNKPQNSIENQPTDSQTERENPAMVNVPDSLKNIDINLKDLPFQLSPEEMKLLDFETQGQNKIVGNDYHISDVSNDDLESQATIRELMERAKIAEETYHFARAIDIYKNALNLENDNLYQVNLPILYAKIAKNYQKLADNENALKYYLMAKDFYEKNKELVKANYIRLNISKLYYDGYKFDKTKEALSEILRFHSNPAILTTKTYLQLANLESNLANVPAAFEFYKKSIDSSNESMDIETLSEIYFKYALALDDKGDFKAAIEYYEKCIKVSEDPNLNKFLSSAYSNIATLYQEKNDIGFAAKNYLRAYEIDKTNDNFDGMYYAASKIAQLLQKNHPEEALKFFKKALECAKKINDIFYIASSSLAIGDFHYDQKHDETALKYYNYAYELVKNEFSKDNIAKIEMRINDIRFKLGEELFAATMKRIIEAPDE